jgi:palmitoyltransferase ZDHHC9/14/18
MSVISSTMSDTESERGGDDRTQPLGRTGPPGDPGLPPSRPSTATTSKKAPGSAAGSRPPSSYGRTHVPSLTSSAFFRPMSSQRLQAQRGARPMSNLAGVPRSVPGGDGKENRAPGTATSLRSTSTALGGSPAAVSTCSLASYPDIGHEGPIRLIMLSTNNFVLLPMLLASFH